MPRNISEIVEQQVSRWNSEQAFLKEKMAENYVPKPVVTISRLLGSDGSTIAKKLAERLDCQLVGIQIVDEIIKRSEIRKELVDAIDEKSRSQIATWIEKMIHGQTLDGGDQLRYHLEAINYFMNMGNVVMLGRGASYVPKTRPRIDVRIVASTKNRVARIMEREKSSKEDALLKLEASDSHRGKFIKQLFGVDWWDSREYDIIINTDHIGITSAVAIIESTWLKYVTKFTQAADTITNA